MFRCKKIEDMKKIYNNIIPLKGFTALTMWPFIFIRNGKTLTNRGERHETTHALQQIECLGIIFFILYGLEYLLKLCFTFSCAKAYMSISFEQEAYEHQDEVYYNEVRKHYAWIKYIFKLK